MAEGPSVSVVIATRDRPAMLAAAVEALRRNLRPADEAFIVDSASRDPSVRRIAEDAGITLIRLERPGTSRARNAGLAATSAPLIGFVDDDCLIGSDWTEAIEKAFDDPRVGFVTGRADADRQTRLPVSLVGGEERRWFDPSQDPSRLGGGANMAFRRSALDSVGGFDEGMGPSTRLPAAEDHDVFWRLLRAGWAGFYDPSLVVVHRQWRTTGQAIRRQFAYGVGIGALGVKMIRSGDPQGWPTLRARLWKEGFVLSLRHLLRGYESGSVGAAVKATGVAAGALRAWRTPLIEGRFHP